MPSSGKSSARTLGDSVGRAHRDGESPIARPASDATLRELRAESANNVRYLHAESPRSAETARGSDVTYRSAEPGMPEKIRVLIVDDDSVDLERSVRMLRQQSRLSVDVVAVETLEEAEARIHQEWFDCVLVDYLLQDRCGLELLNRHHGDEDAPIVLLTGHGSESLVMEAMRQGVADYLMKSSLTGQSLARSIVNAVEKATLRRAARSHVRTLESVNALLSARKRESENFYHSVSHELKTPLTAAREFVTLVVDGVAGHVSDGQRELLIHAIDCCDQMAMHFNDLMDAARLDTGKLTISRRPAEIATVVLRARMSVLGYAEARGIHLTHHLAPHLPAVNIDTNRILQVIANLLTNAIKFTPTGGRVRIAAQPLNDDAVQISVSDNGCGIEPEHVERIFERLYQVRRLEEEPDAGGGLGLGLWIAQQIVELHGSKLQVETRPKRGSIFYFSVPIVGREPHEAVPIIGRAPNEQEPPV